MNHGYPPNWKLQKPRFMPAKLSEGSKSVVYAFISTWYDGDIIGATVRNCFRNRCDRVFVQDNDSPDDSVRMAEQNGADVVNVFKTEYYDDDLRIKLQNDFVRKLVEAHKHDDIWVLTLDADELPIGPNGEPFYEILSRLPRSIRTIGSNAIDLYPDAGDVYDRDKHPAACFKKGIRRTAKFACQRNHWKHVAIRYLDGVFDIAQSRGNHYPAVPSIRDNIYEPEIEIPIFHAPIRNKEEAYARLEALCGKPNAQGHHRSIGDDIAIGGQGAIKRFNSLDAIFSQQWQNVDLPHSQMYGRNITGICPYAWSKLEPNLVGSSLIY
jgi:glycosyltransferase involved in cell wall biosynthesis